jgi:CRISPR/Cas system-associated exonuclease Cas4 (RecB family)
VRAQITSTAQRIRERRFPAEPLKPEAKTCRACPYERVCPESWFTRGMASG